MNKLLTYAGTQPIYLGDIDFLQDAASAVFVNLAKALLNTADAPNAILQGVTLSYPTTGTVSWSGGVVVIDGEILPVDPGTISVDAADSLYFHVSSTLSGARTFKDGQSHQCYDTRKAVLTTESTDGILYASMDANRLRLNTKAVYVATARSSAIAPTPSLKVKNEVFYFDAAFNVAGVAAEGQDIGYFEFNIQPLEQIPQTGLEAFYDTMGVYYETGGAAHVIPLSVTVLVEHVAGDVAYDKLRLEISVPATPSALNGGSGSINGIIPVL